MNNIENKIVQMRFDNAQFEAAIAQTMNTLDKFKEKLNFKGAEKGLDNLGKTTGNYNYTLNDIGSSLDMLTNRFSTMGTIGGRILENLTDKAINFATNGLGNMLSGITQGGLSRAMNLEQAKFQMQGIYKDAEKVYEIIYDDILPELQGTPYSLDQAAVVIGQLGASGIQSADQVRQATRAIAGLAAMSGRGFDEVGRIFSKVAGQGSMMGGELQQLSTYGINAAANIKDYFLAVEQGNADASESVKNSIAEIKAAYGDIDESAIRDAASKRMIDYESMASAMDYLYGAHAKKSTEMYTGALEDLKAALARIGAEPAAIGLEVLRNAFNALVPAVDAVNAVLKGFTSATKKVVTGADGEKVFGGEMIGSLAKQVQNAGLKFANLFVEMDKNGKITRWTAEGVEKYRKALEAQEAAGQKVLDWQKDYAAYASEGDAIMNPHMWRTITALTKSFTNTMTALGKVLGAIGKGFAKAFPKAHLKSIASLAEGIERFTAGLILSEKNLKRLTDISQAVFTPIGLVVRVAIQAIKAFIAVLSAVYTAIKPALNAIFSFISAVSRTIIGIGEMAVEFSGTAVGALVKFTTTVVGAIVKFLQLDKIFNFIQKAIYKLADVFDLVGDSAGGFFQNLFENTQNIAKSVNKYLGLSKALDILRNGFIRLKEGLAQMLHIEAIGKAIQGIINQIKEFFTSGDLLPKLLKNIKNFIDWIKELEIVDKIVNRVSDAFDRLVSTVSNLTAGPSSKIVGWIKKLGQHLRDMFDAFGADDGEYFKKTFKDAIGSISPTLKSFFSTLSDFKNKVKPLLEAFRDFFPIILGFDSWGDMMVAAGNKIRSFGRALAELFGFIGGSAAAKATDTLDRTGKSIGKFIDKNFTNNLKGFGDALNNVKESVSGKFGNIGTILTKAFEGLEPTSAKKIVSTLLTFLMAFVYIKRMKQISRELGALNDVIRGFASILDGIGSGFGLKKVNSALASTIKLVGFAAALLLFATALSRLSDVDWKHLIAGAALMGAALIAFYKIFELLEGGAGNNKLLKEDRSKNLLKMGLAMLSMSAAILIIAKAMDAIGSLDLGQWAKGLGAVIVILAAFTAIMALMSKRDFKGDASGSFSKAAFSFLGLAKGMLMMADAIKAIGDIDTTQLIKGVAAIVALMTALGFFAKSVTADAKVFSAAVGMIAVAAALMMIVKAISMVQGLMDADSFVNAFLVVIDILVAMALFAHVVSEYGTSLLAAGAGIMLLAQSLMVISAAMWLIGAMPIDTLEKAGIAMAGLFAGIILFAHFASGEALKAGAGLLLLSAAVLTLAGSLLVLASLDFGLMLAGMLRLVAMATAAGIAILILSKLANNLDAKGVINITLMSAAMLMLATSLALLAALPLTALAIALGVLVVAVLALGAALLLFSSVSVGMIAAAAAFAILGVAVALVGAGMFLFVTALTALIPLLLSLSMIDTEMLSDGLEVLKTAAEGVGDALSAVSVGIISFGIACIIAAVGVGLVAAAFGLLSAAGILCAISILSLAAAISVLSAVLQSSLGEGLFQGIINGFSNLGSSIKTGFASIWSTLRDNKTEAYNAGSESMSEAARGAEEGASANKPRVDAAIKQMLSGHEGSYQEMIQLATSSSTQEGSAYADGLSGSEPEVTAALEQMLSGTGTGLDSAGLQFGTSGNQHGADYASGLLGQSGSADGAGKTLGSKANSGAKSGASGLRSTGQSGGASYAGGVSSKSGTASAAGKTISKSAQAGASNHSGFYAEGQNAGSGFAAGIRSMISSVASAAASMVRRAISAAKAAQRSHSPSKEFAELGKWADEGYIAGMKAMSGKVESTANDVIGGGLDSVAAQIMQISDAFSGDMDFDPTITPVVDLTNVDRSVDHINEAFKTMPLYSTNSAAMMASSFVDLRNQNDRNSSLNKLANKIDSMTETMNSRALNNYITIDGAGDPEAFADGLIRSFRLNARTV